MSRIHADFVSCCTSKMEAFQQEQKQLSMVMSDPTHTKWLIANLVRRGIPFKTIPHGAGVLTVTTDTKICPKCGGTGRC